MDPQVADYTFLTAIARGWGLAVRCHACERERRWTDADLEERLIGLTVFRARAGRASLAR